MQLINRYTCLPVSVGQLLRCPSAWLWCLVACLLILFAGCVRDDNVCYDEEDDGFLYLTVRLPEQLAGTYGSLSDIDEQQIETIDLLSFWVEGATGEELFLYKSVGEEELLSSNGSQRTFKIQITEYNNVKQKLVLVANARAAMQALGDIPFRTPKEEVISLVEAQAVNGWQTDPFVAFPMWGETTDGVYINTGAGQSSVNEEIQLLRMVVRIDVAVASAVRSEFRLKEVYLYNHYEQARVIPSDSVFNKTTQTVTAASLPGLNSRVEGPVWYPDMTLTDIEIAQSIYLVENEPSTDPLLATCLVIGGVYGTDTDPTYYRLDFRSTDGRSFRSLLRNHNYSLTITSVLGSGYDTPDEAFRNTWKNIEAQLTEWNLCDIEFSDNDRYSLRCAPAAFWFMRNDASAPEEGSGRNADSFTIYTDYDNDVTGEKGWYASLTHDASAWLEIDGSVANTGLILTGDPEQEYTYDFRITSDYTDNPHFRHVALKVQAGKLIKYIDFYQTNEIWVEGETGVEYEWAESEQSDTDIDGPYRLGVSQSLFELTKKEDETLSFNVSTDYTEGYEATVDLGNGDPGWLSIVSGGSLAAPGEEMLVFAVTHNNVNYNRSGSIEVRAGNLVKMVHVRQVTMIDGGVDLEMEWVYSEHSDNDLDGPYKLGVTQTYYSLLSNDYTGLDFYVTTDWPGGYTAAVVEGDTWITNLSPAASSGEVTAGQITFDVDFNNSVYARGGKILVQAGTMKKYIVVEQLSPGSTGGTDLPMYWTESDQAGNEVYGPYRLGVSETIYELTKNQQTQRFYVTTDYRDGFTATVEMDDDAGSNWLTVTNGGSSAAEVTLQELVFDVAENNSSMTRAGRIVLQAGILKKIIGVTQLNTASGGIDTENPWNDSDQSENELDGPYTLTLGRGEFEFSNEAHSGIPCTVIGEGGGTWTATASDTWITLNTASGAADGSHTTLTFQVAAYSGGSAREGSIRISLAHGGNQISKEIRVVQYADRRVDVAIDNSYEADELVRHYFTVLSHSGWVVEVSDDPAGVVRTLHTTGGAANAGATHGDEETRVYFALNEMPAGSYTATFTIRSLSGMYQPYEVPIEAVK
ncbi:MAG: hypothetical protein LUF85_13725 [Bacteroides sp.]|nr:hypothetical protein [Bacteroides sp.]